MNLIRYNSKSEEFKKPFGAVKTDEEITFFIHISKEIYVHNINFVIRRDSQSESIYISMHKSGEYDLYNIFSCTFSADISDLYFYRFELSTPDGIRYIGLKDGEACMEEWLPEWQLTVYDKNFKAPHWVKGAIMYQIFPDRFAKSDKFSPLPSKNPRKIHENWFDIPDFIYDNPDYKANDYYCGNIKGVIEKLDYLKSLGVTIIYFNPIFESPEYHRYSTGNYLNIDPYFGTNEQFKELCAQCKKAGIKVILDGVFSHTGADSIYFNKYGHYDSLGGYNSENSPYYSWYNFIEFPDKYESWWGFENLPNVNEKNKDYLNFITGKDGVIEYWQKMGASGWRLDVADELPDEFLDELYKRAKQVENESFIIGEVWEDATNKFAYGIRRRYLLGGQMDSVMNYPWRTAILDFVKGGDEKLFNDRLLSILENYPPHVINSLMNSISTHDTLRAITYFGVDHDVKDEDKGRYVMSDEEYNRGKSCLKKAAFLQFTLPGIPSIYYGDEAGLGGFRDPYCRMGYPYGKEDIELLSYYKKLGEIRNKYRDDFSDTFKLYEMNDGLYAFTRGSLICAVNFGNTTKYLKADNKKVIFKNGKTVYFDHGIDLYPDSFIILK